MQSKENAQEQRARENKILDSERERKNQKKKAIFEPLTEAQKNEWQGSGTVTKCRLQVDVASQETVAFLSLISVVAFVLSAPLFSYFFCLRVLSPLSFGAHWCAFSVFVSLKFSLSVFFLSPSLSLSVLAYEKHAFSTHTNTRFRTFLFYFLSLSLSLSLSSYCIVLCTL